MDGVWSIPAPFLGTTRSQFAKSNLISARPMVWGFEAGFSVPGINTHIGVIDVSNDDLSSFRVIRKGSKAMGLQGFTHRDLNTLSPNGVHWTLLLDMVWMKKDFRPVYVATELAIDSVPLHYSSLLLPLADNDESSDGDF